MQKNLYTKNVNKNIQWIWFINKDKNKQNVTYFYLEEQEQVIVFHLFEFCNLSYD